MSEEPKTPPAPPQQGDDAPERPPPLPAYLGGYALGFGGIIAFALLLVLLAKLLR